jgi:cytochrome c
MKRDVCLARRTGHSPGDIMRRAGRLLCTLIIIAAFTHTALAEDTHTERGTKEEVVALVKSAVAYFKANGPDKAFAEFSDSKGKFVDRDMYILVYDSTGTCLAHGLYKNLIGKNRIDVQDADGNYYIGDRIKLMKIQSSFWTHYKYPDPLTHKIVPKTSYCETANDPAVKDIIICSGTYDAK